MQLSCDFWRRKAQVDFPLSQTTDCPHHLKLPRSIVPSRKRKGRGCTAPHPLLYRRAVTDSCDDGSFKLENAGVGAHRVEVIRLNCQIKFFPHKSALFIRYQASGHCQVPLWALFFSLNIPKLELYKPSAKFATTERFTTKTAVLHRGRSVGFVTERLQHRSALPVALSPLWDSCHTECEHKRRGLSSSNFGSATADTRWSRFVLIVILMKYSSAPRLLNSN